MKNLIIDASNYGSLIGGKEYAYGTMACNYPINLSVFNADITVTQGGYEITTAGDFTLLLGGDLQNTNVPVYKWLADGGSNGIILELSHIIDSTRAVLKVPCAGANGTYEFGVIDFYGQPAVEQTFGIDATSGFATPVIFFTKYGSSSAVVGATQQPLGSDPVLINLTEYPTAGLNIQYL